MPSDSAPSTSATTPERWTCPVCQRVLIATSTTPARAWCEGVLHKHGRVYWHGGSEPELVTKPSAPSPSALAVETLERLVKALPCRRWVRSGFGFQVLEVEIGEGDEDSMSWTAVELRPASQPLASFIAECSPERILALLDALRVAGEERDIANAELEMEEASNAELTRQLAALRRSREADTAMQPVIDYLVRADHAPGCWGGPGAPYAMLCDCGLDAARSAAAPLRSRLFLAARTPEPRPTTETTDAN